MSTAVRDGSAGSYAGRAVHSRDHHMIEWEPKNIASAPLCLILFRDH